MNFKNIVNVIWEFDSIYNITYNIIYLIITYIFLNKTIILLCKIRNETKTLIW